VSGGFGETAEGLPIAVSGIMRRLTKANPFIRRKLTKAGIAKADQGKWLDTVLSSMIPQRNTHQRLLAAGIDDIDRHYNLIKKVWHKTQDVGATWINLAELIDRGTAVITSMNKAQKRGMTIEQGLYGAYDMILRNNFLGREFNPEWLRNPKWRALFMFQSTPFKIMERRVVNAYRSGRVVKGITKGIREMSRTREGREQLMKEVMGIRAYVKRSEHSLKTNLFVDSIMDEVDFFGSPAIGQLAKDTMIIGAASIGGAHYGMNLLHHFIHIPFISSMHDTPDPKIAYSPGMQAIIRGTDAWKKQEGADQKFLFTNIMQKWMGPAGPFPDIFRKVERINNNDIPEIYRGSKFQYLFAIPGKGGH